MAEFCLKCLQRFEPNANEDNTTLSNYLDWCEGCAELRQVVVEFDDDDNEQMTECDYDDDKCEYWYMGMCELDDRLNVCPHSELCKQLQEFGGHVKNEGYQGLKGKYLVLKADTGEQVTNCFVLRPDKDNAAIEALRTYANVTDNKTLAEDIYNWVGGNE